MAPALLQLRGVGKSFSGVRVLQGIDLEVRPGEVLGLCGANGAGKSTLIKVLTGYFDHYEGEVEVGGRAVHLHTPALARAAGVDAVYQEVDACIAPGLTVAENLILNRLTSSHYPFLTARRRVLADAAEVAAPVGLRVGLTRQAEDLSLHEKQLLVIARAIAQQVRVLIFDEPSTSLSMRETERLFATIRDLRERGMGIVYVSHRLNEVEELCDRVAVLRNGRLVAQFEEMVSTSAIATAMLGAPPEEEFPEPSTSASAEVAFEVRGLRAGTALRSVDLSVRRGEIFGVTGLVGAGKTELLRAIFGADPKQAGEMRIGGERVEVRRPQDAVRHGIYLVPEERRRHGLFLDFSASRNISSVFLAKFCRFGVIRPRAERRGAQGVIERLSIQGNAEGPVLRLSGGNQQKVVIGKWIIGEPRVLLLDEATQGVDIGTRRQIYQLVREFSSRAAVIFASSDIDEVIGLADRFAVMYEGQVAGVFARGEADRQSVIELASGLRKGTVA